MVQIVVINSTLKLLFLHSALALAELLEFLQSPSTSAIVAPLALIAAAPSQLPTFVPLGAPPPTAGGAVGAASGGGILPGVALLAVRMDA